MAASKAFLCLFLLLNLSAGDDPVLTFGAPGQTPLAGAW
jgi:hypothetical protein